MVEILEIMKMNIKDLKLRYLKYERPLPRLRAHKGFYLFAAIKKSERETSVYLDSIFAQIFGQYFFWKIQILRNIGQSTSK